jgi:transposase InsO family protein
VRYGLIREQQKAYPVTVLCSVMQVSTRAYYAWARPPEAAGQAKESQAFGQRVRQVFEDSRQTYGSRRIAAELKKSGTPAGRHKVRSAMARLGLQARHPRRFRAATDSRHREAVSPNRLDRQFGVAAPIKPGLPTSPACGRWRAGFLSPSSWTCSPGRWWAGPPMPTCGRTCA